MLANGVDHDQTLCSVASELGLHGLPKSEKRDARHKYLFYIVWHIISMYLYQRSTSHFDIKFWTILNISPLESLMYR